VDLNGGYVERIINAYAKDTKHPAQIWNYTFCSGLRPRRESLPTRI
jgi:hypothetical protein